MLVLKMDFVFVHFEYKGSFGCRLQNDPFDFQSLILGIYKALVSNRAFNLAFF